MAKRWQNVEYACKKIQSLVLNIGLGRKKRVCMLHCNVQSLFKQMFSILEGITITVSAIVVNT